MRSLISTTLIAFTFFCISSRAQAAITLTGDVDADFTNANCLSDEGGEDVGIPSSVSATGWDIDKVCFYYDGNTDDLYIGVTTINNVIFGDADGDGDPSSSSASCCTDRASLGSGESFVLSMDLDGDSRDSDFDVDTVDLLVGISNSGSISNLGAYNVSNSYDPLNNPGLGFGGTSEASVDLFANPSASVPDLEFIIQDFKQIQVHGVNDIINEVELQVFAGSTVDAGIGDDYLPNSSTSVTHPIFDYDEDGLEDWDELDNQSTDPTNSDSDGDELLDGTEVEGSNPTDPNNPDTDADTCNDGVEDSNHNGAFEPALGESNPNVADTDSDEIDDCTELTGANPTDPNNSDSDSDTCSDGTEDANHNGTFEPDLGESNPNIADTDGGGVNDCDELNNGFDPNDPNDDQQAASQIAAALGFNQVQGGGVSCSLNSASTAEFASSQQVVLIAGLFSLALILRVRSNRQSAK